MHQNSGKMYWGKMTTETVESDFEKKIEVYSKKIWCHCSL